MEQSGEISSGGENWELGPGVVDFNDVDSLRNCFILFRYENLADAGGIRADIICGHS
jgi:hypothetical protein